MKLSGAINGSKLSRGQLVTGEQSLDTEVSWVQVVDHPDIEPWVSAGHLLLTTGYNWPKEPGEATDIIQTLHRKGLAGVVLAVPKFLEHFPDSSIAVAETLGFPLIELPWEVPFSELTQEIHRVLLDEQAQLILRSERIHSELTHAAVVGQGLQELTVTLGQLLERPVIFTDAEGRQLAEHGWAELGLFSSVGGRLSLEEQMSMLENLGWLRRVRESRTRVYVPPMISARLPARVAYPIRTPTELFGIAWVIENDMKLGELDMRAVEHAGTVASLLLSHRRELSAQEARLGYAFVDSLLEGRFEATPAAVERAKLLGWDAEQRYRVCAVLMNEPVPLSREGFLRREKLAESIKRQLEFKKQPPLLSMSLNQVQFLLADTVSPESIWEVVGNRSCAMAASRVMSGASGMKSAREDISILLPVLRPGKLHHFQEMLLPRALQGDPHARELFLQQTLGPLRDRKQSETSLQTLTVLANEGFHLANTAKLLNIHISSLRYRVEKMEELLNVSFDDPDVRFRLQVALQLDALVTVD